MDTLERYSPNENLTRDEAAWRAAQVTLQSIQVTLDVSNAAEREATSFASESVLEFDSASTETFIDFIHESVDSIWLNDEPVNVADAVLDARIYLTGLNLGRNTVRIHGRALYSRSGEGLHRFVDPSDAQTYLYTQFEPSEARRVFACFEQPDIKGSYSFTLRGPADWHLASNQPVVDTEVHEDGTKTVRCAPTPPISSYITAVLAGPYHVVRDVHEQQLAGQDEPLRIELAATCRASLADDFDGEQILELTKQGLRYFHELFDYPYPWGKYDSAFVPEYNLGAMENPGLVTFTERYVFTSAATEAQHEQRANTIMHEMAHMWFGDLVTMKWWDDLWLKESFADYIGTLAVDEGTAFSTAWTTFAARRKAWAYVADQMPTTHPIVADIVDLQAADQNFDGITYAKGASVLKQLAAYVGQDAFREAARAYFVAHAFSNTTLDDFLIALEEASGRDMRAWAQAWLMTSGVPRLRVELRTTDDGIVSEARLVQEGTDPLTGEPIVRPHVLSVGSYNLREGALERTTSHRVELVGEHVELDFLIGQPAPDLVLPNDGDETYALIDFDDRSLATLLEHLGQLTDSLPRATCWASLWDAVRGARLSADRYLEAILRHGDRIGDAGVFGFLLDQLLASLNQYLAAEHREAACDEAAAVLTTWLTRFEANGDQQILTARTLARLARGAVATEVIEELMTDSSNRFGLDVDEQLRWLCWQALAASGRLDAAAEERMRADLAAKPSAVAENSLRTALAARPEPEVKSVAFHQVLEAADASGPLSNDALSAIAEGFSMGSAELLAPFETTYWQSIAQVFDSMSMEFATRVIRGLFPRYQQLQTPVELDPSVIALNAWLEAHPQAPKALVRILLEERDGLLRRLRAQELSARVALKG
ncbi:aminopeptidase N [Glutamicibacter sp. X7]